MIEYELEKTIDTIYNSITDSIEKQSMEKESIEKKSVASILGIGLIPAAAEFAFKQAPLGIFGLSFLAGALEHLSTKGLTEQEIKHKNKMNRLKKEKEDIEE